MKGRHSFTGRHVRSASFVRPPTFQVGTKKEIPGGIGQIPGSPISDAVRENYGTFSLSRESERCLCSKIASDLKVLVSRSEAAAIWVHYRGGPETVN